MHSFKLIGLFSPRLKGRKIKCILLISSWLLFLMSCWVLCFTPPSDTWCMSDVGCEYLVLETLRGGARGCSRFSGGGDTEQGLKDNTGYIFCT